MMSPLEYLFFAMMSTQNPDPAAVDGMKGATPTTTAGQHTALLDKDGRFEMKTILMEPRDSGNEKLEAPLRILPEWIPAFTIGAPLKIQIDETRKTYDARVSRIESITDSTGMTVQVIAELNKATADVEPGMTALASFTKTVTQ